MMPPSSRPLDIRSAIADFSEKFAATFNTAIEYGKAQWGDEFTDEIFRRLEVSPGNTYDAPIYFCVRSYSLVRQPGYDEDRQIAMEVREHVRSEVSDTVYDKMRDAQMGVWQLRIGKKSGLRAERVDGLDSGPIELAAAVDSSWEDLSESGTYVGWLVELQEQPVLFFAARVDSQFEAHFNRAAGRRPWGEGRSFRRVDYEEDVLAMLIDSNCVDTKRDHSRVFLSRWVDSYSMSAEKLAWRVCERIDDFGLPTADPDEPDELLKEFRYCKSCRAYHYKGEGSPNWALDLAVALGDDSRDDSTYDNAEAILETLRIYRAWALGSFSYFETAFGPKTADYLLPDDSLAGLVHLNPDGRIDDPRVADADRYRIEVLGLDPARLRAAGVSADWAISQGLAWARHHADEELVDDLTEAAQRHRTALRWASLVAKSAEADRTQADATQAARVTYAELLEGLEDLIPHALQTPIAELEDPGRHTWSRLDKVLREHDGFDAPVVRLSHLPQNLDTLGALPGVGSKTLAYLQQALSTFVAQWPRSAGHHPLVTSQQSSNGDEQAADELSRGLDELDELF